MEKFGRIKNREFNTKAATKAQHLETGTLHLKKGAVLPVRGHEH
jgi:hypothetical protein